MFNYYNPHPENKRVGDCVKRALTKASGKSYRDVSIDLNRIKRSIGASAYNVKNVWDKYLRESLYATYESYPAVKGQSRMTVKRFCEEYPKGTYVLNVAKHMVCVVDGHFYDTWDCGEKCVYGSYKVPKMMPMPGIEKLSELRAKYSSAPTKLSGNDIIYKMATIVDAEEIKKTKKNELWFSFPEKKFDTLFHHLANDEEYEHLIWKTRRGSMKTTIYDEKTGMTLILKGGAESGYLWCTNPGE